VTSVLFPVSAEPTTSLVERGLELARREACDLVMAIGGGSPMDAGKAIAALLTNPGELMDYLEIIGRAQPLRNPSAPYIAIPTTAGTGSEVTRNAVLGSEEHRIKVSLRSPFMLPRVALVDPELTLDLPRPTTAWTGFDALTQLIEPYVCCRANPLTDGFAVEGLKRVARSFRKAFHSGRNLEVRTDMSLAALLGGLALSNAGLGVIHGFASPIGGRFSAPHGAVCAALLSHGMAANIRALRARAPESEALRRYEIVARILTGSPAARPEDGVTWVDWLAQELEIPPLSAHGIRESDAADLAEKAARANSTKANPIALTAEEFREVVMGALG
jgi:alcohol dehydrogenase class IV